MVALTDFASRLPGVVLTLVGAHGMGWLGGFSLGQAGCLAWDHVLFILSGVIWLVVLVPTQTQPGRLAASFSTSASIPARCKWSYASSVRRHCAGVCPVQRRKARVNEVCSR